MFDVLTNIILGASAGVAVSATVSLIRKWLESVQFHRKITLKVKDKEIQVDAARIEELKHVLASLLDEPQVFIAYAFKDKDFARKLTEDLKENGLRVWLAEDQIKPGDSITNKIEEGLTGSGYLIALLSRSSLESHWVQEEFKTALFREQKGKWPRVIPVLIDSVEVPSYIRDKLYVDMRKNYEEGIEKIIMAVKHSNEQNPVNEGQV